MVGAADPAADQKLSHKVDRGSLALARVSPPSRASITPSLD